MGSFDEIFIRFAAAGLFIDAVDDALLDRFQKRDRVQAPAHRVPPLQDVANELRMSWGCVSNIDSAEPPPVFDKRAVRVKITQKLSLTFDLYAIFIERP